MKTTLDPISRLPLINSVFEKREALVEISANGKEDVTPEDDESAKKKETSRVTTPVSSDSKSRSATTTKKEDHPTTSTRSGTVYV
jgi:hypothetical protein